MESQLLQLIAVFIVGLICGALIMLLWNKLSSGSASAAGLKLEYQEYQEQVEAHFEQTSKKFQDMTEQYQDLYKHLSLGATSLCRPDSVAAELADESKTQVKIGSQRSPITPPDVADKTDADNNPKDSDAKPVAKEDSVKSDAGAVKKNSLDDSKVPSTAENPANKKKDVSS